MYLHLDPLFKPYSVDEISYEKMTFSGGEPHLKIQGKIPPNTKITITSRIRSFNDLGFICLAADALKRMQSIPDTLIIPYFPAARQDSRSARVKPNATTSNWRPD